MKGLMCILGAILVAMLAVLPAQAWEGTVVKVLDGDSIRVQRDGRDVEVRLYGIDTPEYRQPYSSRARQFTREMLFGRGVSVEEKDTDRYGRTVALVTFQNSLVNRELIRVGLAWYNTKYCLAQPLCSELATLEQEARTARRGLWADADPVSPWEWKRKNRSDSPGGTGWFRRLLDPR